MCAALHPHNFHPLTTSSGVFVGFFESMYEQLKRHSGLIDQLLAAEEQRRSPMSHSNSIYIVTSKPDAPGAYETAEQKRHQIFERELAEHQHEPGALKAQQPKEIRMNDKQVGGTCHRYRLQPGHRHGAAGGHLDSDCGPAPGTEPDCAG